MRLFTLTITLLVIANMLVSAQPPDTLWTRTFGGEGWDSGNNVKQTDDGGYIIAGSTTSFGVGHSDIWLLKTDSTGREEWSRTFGEINNDYGRSVHQTNDGGYIIVGSIGSNNPWNSDVRLIKVDSTGNDEWIQTFGGEGSDDGYCIQQTIDGGFIISGLTNSFGNGVEDGWLIKTDSNGEEEWNQTYGGQYNDYLLSVQQTNDGGYIATGYTNSRIPDVNDVWMVKTDSTGNEQWDQTFGGGADDFGKNIHQTVDEGYIIVGVTESFSAGIRDVLLIKTDSTGNEQWHQTFGDDGWNEGYSLKQTNDGGYIIIGNTESLVAVYLDVWLIKTDSDGEVEWEQTFGGTDDDWGTGVDQTGDSGYIIIGNTDPFFSGNWDVLLIRVDSEGNEIIESTMNYPTDYFVEEVYPNPFNSSTTISVELPRSSELKLSVYNITGQEVAVLANEQCSVGYHHFTFNAGELSSGIYFIHARVPGKMDEVRKVVLLR